MICGREIRPAPMAARTRSPPSDAPRRSPRYSVRYACPTRRPRGGRLHPRHGHPALAGPGGQPESLAAALLPTDSCGKPRAEVIAALAGPQWTTVDSRTVGQLGSPATDAAGCSPRWTDMVWVETNSGRPGRPDRSPRRPPGRCGSASTRCPGAAGSGKPAGDFVYGGPLPAERQAGVLRALANRRAVADCATPASRFAVLRPMDGGGPDRYVELDGCRRFLVAPPAGGAQLGQGDAMLAELLGPN
ncbi:hypothetical protein NKG94_43845 [Micromonospora sp. M12]